MTEEDTPYNFSGEDGQPTGFTVELTQEIQKRTGNADPDITLHWQKALDALKQDGTWAKIRNRWFPAE